MGLGSLTLKPLELSEFRPYILDTLFDSQAKIMKVRMWLIFSCYAEWNGLCQLCLDNIIFKMF